MRKMLPNHNKLDKENMELPINTIICGDSLKIMKDWYNCVDENRVDLVLTDPDYNAKDIGRNHKKYDTYPMQRKDYGEFCVEWFNLANRIGEAIIFTPGIANTHFYPQPFWQICWHKPASSSFNRMGGFNAWEPIFTYGKVTKAKLGQDYILCNVLNLKKGAESEHPCPKPLPLMIKLLEHFSEPNDFILDPFCGSGTTCVAAKMLGRHYIGIDISEKYCEIARMRIRAVDTGVPAKEQLKGQMGLFDEKINPDSASKTT